MNATLRRLIATAALGVCALAPPAAFAAPDADQVLVRFGEDTTRAQMREAARSLGAVTGEDLMGGWRVYTTRADLTQAEVDAALAGHDATGQLDLALVRPAERASDPLRPGQLNLDQIGLDEMPGAGEPVVVAVIDTPVLISHPDLSASLWTNPGEIPGNGIDDDANGLVDDIHGWNMITNSSQVAGPSSNAHGTHVAGIIAAGVSNGRGITGVAANARIMVVPFLNGNTGHQSDAIRAIEYATDNGARIINASWTTPNATPNGPMCSAIAEAGRRGVLVVAAAGNDSANLTTAPLGPAACPGAHVIGVGAHADTNPAGLASFSNYSTTHVDLVAPGVGIVSLGTTDTTYSLMQGTSMAAPHVSGAAALLAGWWPQAGNARIAASVIWHGPTSSVGSTRSGRRLHLPSARANMAAAGAGDTTAPGPFTLVGVTQLYEGRPTFTWSEADERGSGLAEYQVFVDGQRIVSVEGSLTSALAPAPLAPGSHTWHVRAVDVAGNARVSNTGTFTAGPEGEPFRLIVPAYVHATSWPVRWRTLDPSAISSYELRVNGMVFDRPPVSAGNGAYPCEASWICLAALRGGPARFELIAHTPLGSVSRSATTQMIPAPVPVVADMSGTDPRPMITWSIDGEPAAIASQTLLLDGSSVPLDAATRSLRAPTELAVGSHTATIQVTMLDGTVTSESGRVVVSAPAAEPGPGPRPEPSPAPAPAPGPAPSPSPAPAPGPAPSPGPAPGPSPGPAPAPERPRAEAPARIVAPIHRGRVLVRSGVVRVRIAAPAGATRMAITLGAPRARDWTSIRSSVRVRLRAGARTQIIRVAFRSPSGAVTTTRLRVLVDRSRPTARILGAGANRRLVAKDVGSGVSSYQVRVGARPGAWISYRPRVVLPEGTTQVRVRDRAGNVGAWVRVR